MAKYISAVEAAEKAETALKIPLAALVDVFAGIPAADVAPVRHGRWETHYRSGTTVPKGVVSGCCDMWNERKTPYCPQCGAKMMGETHESEKQL